MSQPKKKNQHLDAADSVSFHLSHILSQHSLAQMDNFLDFLWFWNTPLASLCNKSLGTGQPKVAHYWFTREELCI